MPLVDLQCPSCSQAMRVNTDQLPDQPASLKCPTCQGLMTVEKSRLLAALGQQAAPAQAPPAPAPPQAPAPSQAAAPSPPSTPPANPSKPASSDDGPEPVSKIEVALSSAPEVLLPPGFELDQDTRLPSGVVVVVDPAPVQAIADGLARFGGELKQLSSMEQLKHFDLLPPLIIYVDGAGGNRQSDLESLRMTSPKKRRRTFAVLVNDDDKTLDGQRAFYEEVDLIVNKADVAQFAEVLKLALDFKDRLWAPMLAAEDERVG